MFKKCIIALSLTLLGLLLAFFSIEIYEQISFRVLGEIPKNIRIQDFRYSDLNGAPTFLPNAVGWHRSYGGRSDILININSLGFRGAELPASPSIRIAMLGDSVLFNGAVPDPHSFSNLLEQNLKLQFTHSNFSVLNLGEPDLNIQQYFLQARSQVPMLHPDLLVVNIYLNDSQPFPGLLSPTPARALQIPWYHSFALEKFTKLINDLSALQTASFSARFDWAPIFTSKTYLTNESAWNEMKGLAQLDWGIAWQQTSWDKIGGYLESIIETLQIPKSHILLIVHPISPQVEIVNPYPDLFDPQLYSTNMANKLGLALLNPLPYLRSKYHKQSDPHPFYYDQCHLTDDGNLAISEYLSPEVTKLIHDTTASSTLRIHK